MESDIQNVYPSHIHGCAYVNYIQRQVYVFRKRKI